MSYPSKCMYLITGYFYTVYLYEFEIQALYRMSHLNVFQLYCQVFLQNLRLWWDINIRVTFHLVFFKPYKEYFENILKVLNNFMSVLSSVSKNKPHICILNRKGPKIDPCGTPAGMSLQLLDSVFFFHPLYSLAKIIIDEPLWF